ncbi:MAG: NAD(P)/FAD-dependent oxidoreductase [Micropepsaceae bacterium]
MAAAASGTRPHIVIVGGGFGGLAAAKALKSAPADITLVDRRNHHLFQPLLYQVATAALSPAQIAQPIRAVLRRQQNATVILDEVTGIDRAAKTLTLASGAPLAFDSLILATGATHAYFGHDDWAPFAPGLKSLDDATAIRRRILDAFERAEVAKDAAAREALLTFVIVGAGPTGVEMAGAIAELAHRTLACEFRHIDTMKTRIVLIEAGPRVLAAMPEKLSARGLKALQRLSVEVRLGEAVTVCSAEGVTLGGTFIPARTIIWAAGVQASPAAAWLGPETPRDRAGRVQVAGDLSVPGSPDIFVIGDTASVVTKDGKPVPGVAPAAKQMGKNVAKRLLARLKGRAEPPPFAYADQGNLATIGRGAGLVDLGWLKLSGQLGWWFWGLVHIFFLIDFRNRVSVSLDWLWSYLTFGRSARLMTEGDRRAVSPPQA